MTLGCFYFTFLVNLRLISRTSACLSAWFLAEEMIKMGRRAKFRFQEESFFDMKEKQRMKHFQN